MGTDLEISINGEINIGRKSFYAGDPSESITKDLESLQYQVDKYKDELKTELASLIGYTPKNVEELHSIIDDVEARIDECFYQALKDGRRQLLAIMLNKGLKIEEC